MRISFDYRGKHWRSMTDCRRAYGLCSETIMKDATNVKKHTERPKDIVINEDRTTPPSQGKKPDHIKRLEEIAFDNEMKAITNEEDYWDNL